MATTGRWNIGSFNVPDFGLVDFKNKKLGSNTGSIGGKVTTTPTKSTYDMGNKTITGGGSVSGATSTRTSSPVYGPVNAPQNYNQPSGGSSNNDSNNDSGNNIDTSGYRDEISSGWDSYIRGLDSQLSGLSTQRGAQEGIVNSQYSQGVNSLGLQRDQGMQALDQDRQAAQQNQVSNLRDISSNIRNAFQAGNVYLGSRGAGDSSAANQYSYALNKMGTQQRSDVMNNTANIMADVDARETNLRNIFDTETRNLDLKKNEQVQQIAVWFADAQNQIKGLQNEGKLKKSQDLQSVSKDLLNQAIAKVNQIEAEAKSRRQILDQWALNNSSTIQEARSKIEAMSIFDPSYAQAQSIQGVPTMGATGGAVNYGGGGSSYEEDRNNLFGGN